MKSMNDESSSSSSNNWLGFSLSTHMTMKMEAANSTSPNFYHLANPSTIFAVDENSDFHMPLKSDGSLCIMEALSKSHSQGVVPNSAPKLEDFLGGASHQYAIHPRDAMILSLQQQHHHYYSNYDIYQTTNDKNLQLLHNSNLSEQTWMDHHLHLNNNNNTSMVESLSLSMSPGSQSSCITASRQISPTETTAEYTAMETKKRGADKLGQKQTVHRKSIDTFGQRTSQYRGVTRHRWTGRYEAHLWDNSCKKEGQTRKGRQVYLGGYDMEEKAARAYDLAALKYWGPSTHINFPLENYHQEIEDMKNMSRQEYVAHLRRKSSGFSRGASIYRGVTRHHQHGRWQARIGRVAGNKDLYLGTFSTQEEAAEAYDIAAIKFRGVNAVTNFDISRYDVEKIMASNTLPAGEIARRNKEEKPISEEVVVDQKSGQVEQGNVCDWKMVVHDGGTVHHQSGDVDVKILNLGNYHNPGFSVGMHDLMSLESGQAESSSAMPAHFSNASSLVTSLSNSREGSPDKYGGPPLFSKPTEFVSPPGNVNVWIPTAQLRPVPPVFAAWNDA